VSDPAPKALAQGLERVVGDPEAQQVLLVGEQLLLGQLGDVGEPLIAEARVLLLGIPEEARLADRAVPLRLLPHRQGSVQHGEMSGPGAEAIEGARAHQGLDGGPVRGGAGDAAAEVEHALEGPLLPRLQDRLDRSTANTLDRRQAEPDVPLRVDSEVSEALVHIGRPDLQAVVDRLINVERDLVLVVHEAGELSGNELGRVVGLQVGRVVRDDPIHGRVGLVEAVARELSHLVEDRPSSLLVHASLNGP